MKFGRVLTFGKRSQCLWLFPMKKFISHYFIFLPPLQEPQYTAVNLFFLLL